MEAEKKNKVGLTVILVSYLTTFISEIWTRLMLIWRSGRWRSYLSEMLTMTRQVWASSIVSTARKYLPSLKQQLTSVFSSKDFIDTNAFKAHIKSKPHKRRLHALKTEPYTVEEAERAAGLGSCIKPTKRKMETLLPAAVLNLETLADVKKRAKLEESTDGDGSIDNEGDVKM